MAGFYSEIKIIAALIYTTLHYILGTKDRVMTQPVDFTCIRVIAIEHRTISSAGYYY